MSIPLQLPYAKPDVGHRAPLLLGLAGAAVAALFVLFHWSAAVFGALLLLILAAFASDRFVLFIVFLTPLSWVLSAELPARDVMTSARLVFVVGFFLGRLFRGQFGFRHLLESTVSKASLLFVVAASLSVLLGTEGWTHESARTMTRLISYVAFYFFVLAWADSQQRARKLAMTLLASTIVVAAFGIFQEIVGGYTSLWLFLNPPDEGFVEWNTRVPSLLPYANSLAGYLNLILPFAIGCYAIGNREKWKKLGAWTFAMGGVTLGLTQSRGGLVAFGCVLLLGIFYFVESWRKRLVLLAGLFVLASGVYVLGEVLNPTHLGEIEDITAASRLLFWATAWDMWVHSPVFGVGFGNFQMLYGSYIHVSWIPEGQFGVHNLYLQLLSETGLIGFLAFVLLAFFAVREARRQLRSKDTFSRLLGFGVIGMMTTLFVHGFVDFVVAASPQFGTLFWTLLALLVANTAINGGVGPCLKSKL
jgi:putative inorganic carbon (hco3(-)) transporter